MTAERMNNDCVPRRNLSCSYRSLVEEMEIGVLVAAAMQPDVKWIRFRRSVRNDHSIRLRRAIDARPVASNHRSSGGNPRRFSLGKGIETLVRLIQRPIRLRKILLLVKFPVQ